MPDEYQQPMQDMAHGADRDNPRGLDPDDPLTPGWQDFIAARERFLATLREAAPPA